MKRNCQTRIFRAGFFVCMGGNILAIHSVSQVNKFLKGMLDRENILRGIMVRGEISNFKCYGSGHCYFTLKDAGSSLKCVMFRSHAQRLRFQPVNGLQIIASGSISVYERDGVYQLYADSLAPEGTGDLSLAFEQLKSRLAAEGLFDAAHKKPLPVFPRKIGVVTSAAGAVLRDICHVSKNRWPQIQLVLRPVQVQGDGAAEQVADAVRFFNEQYPVDVLIVGRGGGSMEDLWAFNEEPVVRAIFASKIPIISAVGHETDYTLTDFAADVRAATPSNAAELAVPDCREVRRHIDGLMLRLNAQARRGVETRRFRLDALLQSRVLQNPQSLLDDRRQHLDRLLQKIRLMTGKMLTERHHRLDVALQKLDVLNPARVLRRGYALAERDGRLVASAKELKPKDKLALILKDGRVPVEVIKTAGKDGK